MPTAHARPRNYGPGHLEPTAYRLPPTRPKTHYLCPHKHLKYCPRHATGGIGLTGLGCIRPLPLSFHLTSIFLSRNTNHTPVDGTDSNATPIAHCPLPFAHFNASLQPTSSRPSLSPHTTAPLTMLLSPVSDCGSPPLPTVPIQLPDNSVEHPERPNGQAQLSPIHLPDLRRDPAYGGLAIKIYSHIGLGNTAHDRYSNKPERCGQSSTAQHHYQATFYDFGDEINIPSVCQISLVPMATSRCCPH